MESKTELQRARLRYNRDDQKKLFRRLNTTKPNNARQQQIFDRIKKAVTGKSEENTFFISGAAGTGT
jgi:hypothetical protein